MAIGLVEHALGGGVKDTQRSAIKRKLAKPKSQRRFKTPRCTVRSCVRAAEAANLCRSHARQEADRLAGDIVRGRGRCEVCGKQDVPLNWAHGFSRRYLAVRWDLRNGFCLCRPCDYRMTNNPLQWDDFIRRRMGDYYSLLRSRALDSTEPPDYAAIIGELRATG